MRVDLVTRGNTKSLQHLKLLNWNSKLGSSAHWPQQNCPLVFWSRWVVKPILRCTPSSSLIYRAYSLRRKNGFRDQWGEPVEIHFLWSGLDSHPFLVNQHVKTSETNMSEMAKSDHSTPRFFFPLVWYPARPCSRSYASLEELLKAIPGGERLCFVVRGTQSLRFLAKWNSCN